MIEAFQGVSLHQNVQPVFLTEGPRSHFFGYYTPSPFDESEEKLLCHSVDFDGRMVGAEDSAEIGFWNVKTATYTCLARTSAFNWQQGSMLCWLPGSHSTKVIYNDRFESHFAARLLDISTGLQQTLPTTIYALTSDGRYALTPRFERLAFCRPGYNYQGLYLRHWDQNVPPGDGIVRMDLLTGECKLILETQALCEQRPLPSMYPANHYLEHLLINPAGTQLIFFHRWQLADGSPYTRLYSANLEGTELCLYPDSGFYSHATWLNNERFFIWGRPQTAYSQARSSSGLRAQLLRPLLGFWRHHMTNSILVGMARQITGDSYLSFSLGNPQGSALAPGILRRDGHPGINPVYPWLLLTDTYQDENSDRHLLLYNLKKNELVELAKIKSLAAYDNSGYRCDLHPRWSPSGSKVCVDTILGDRRQMLVLDVADLLDGKDEY